MLGNRKLILDTHCEIYDMVKHHADGIFWNLEQHIQKNQVVDNAIYVVGREQIRLHGTKVRDLINTTGIKVVFSNPHEGSQTLKTHCQSYSIADLVLDKKIILVGGGDMDPEWPCLQYESFLPKMLDYKENQLAMSQSSRIYEGLNKPYKFLFLNGRSRPHRKYLLERFRLDGLLNQSLWTNLENCVGFMGQLELLHQGQDLMLTPTDIRTLPANYEVDRYRQQVNKTFDSRFIKNDLFGQEWGEIYIEPAPYIDTYFSLVTETVFDYARSFRTEKIWKPIAMAHPWIAVANAGYYRDIKNLGFQTFGHVLDESFDSIEDAQKRIEQIAHVVQDLCQQDLAAFLKECYNVCKYNQQHLAEMRVRVRQEFPDRFLQFVKKYHFDE